MIGDVKEHTRGSDEGALFEEVKVDRGGNDVVTADHFDGAGVDAPPLPIDKAALVDGPGSGTAMAVGYRDTKNAGKAAPGEYRVVARAPDGTIVLEFWGKANGDLEITSIKPGGKVTINGLTIDQDGNLVTPGEVTAKASSPATSVTLSRHVHNSGTGPTTPPTPGT